MLILRPHRLAIVLPLIKPSTLLTPPQDAHIVLALSVRQRCRHEVRHRSPERVTTRAGFFFESHTWHKWI